MSKSDLKKAVEEQNVKAALAARGIDASDIEVDENGVPLFGLDEFKKVETIRTWIRPVEGGGRAIIVLPRRRSKNLAGLFKTKFDKPGQPASDSFVWALELLAKVRQDPEGTCPLMSGSKPVGGEARQLVFMFEPKILREVFENAAQHNFPLLLRSRGKEPIVSRTYGDTLSWTWDCERVARMVAPKNAASDIMLPSAEAAHLLTEHAGDWQA